MIGILADLSRRPAPLRHAVASTAAIALILTALLVADGVAERGRAAREAARVETLEENVLTDAGAAVTLLAEREKQTQRSVRRETRNHQIGWTLLIFSSLFLAAAKRLQSLGEPRPWAPAEAPLVTLGAGPSVSSVSSGRRVGSTGAAKGVDLAFVAEVVAREGRSREAAIPILQALQNHYRYLPESALRRVCELTEVTPSDLVGVASFYSQFRSTPVGAHLVRICHGTACHVAGIGPITDELRRRLEIPDSGDSDAEMRFTLDPVNCLGCCSLAPVMMIDDDVAGRLTPTSACEALAAAEVGP